MAVFTPVSITECQLFLQRYDLGNLLELREIAEGVENTNYYLRTDKGRYILTLFESRVPERDLPYFTRLMQHLAGKTFPCPEPMAATDGSFLQRCNGKPALIVSFLDGTQTEHITPAHCAALGQAVAHFHKATADFTDRRDNALSFDGWQELISRIKGQGHRIAADFDALLQQEYDWLQAHWPEDSPRGTIHADLFPDNVFFADRHAARFAGMIDFYFACTDLLLYELAICINAWCFTCEPGKKQWQFQPELAGALLKAYRQEAGWDHAMPEPLPVLCRGAALRFLLTRAVDFLFPASDALVTVKDPGEYLQKLQFFQEEYDQ